MNLIHAFLCRDIAVEKNYRFQLAIKASTILFQLAIFYFLSRFMGRPDYFAFVFIGLIFSRFFQFWLSVFNETIRQEQYWGTAESIFLAPRPHLRVIASAVIGKSVFLLLEVLLYVGLGVFVFSVPLHFVPALLPAVLLQSAAFAGLGLISGSFIMYFKRGDPVNWLIASSFDLLSGVYFPLSVLPDSLRIFSLALPTTSALAVWRTIVLDGGMPSAVDIAIQFAWAAVLLTAGVLSFRRAMQLVRIKGELGTY